MITNNNCGQKNQDDASAESLAEAHARVALEQSALYSAQLAIARWTSGSWGIHAPVYALDRVTARERWYAQAHHNFQDWLAQGGFSQPGRVEAEPAPVSPLSDLALPGDYPHRADLCLD